jgi:hypothetical protein
MVTAPGELKTDPNAPIRMALAMRARIAPDLVRDRNLIPDLIDQNPCAHRRNPMDMIFQGRSMSVFQA